MINFGDIGAGKSTAGNWMLLRYSTKLKPEYNKLF